MSSILFIVYSLALSLLLALPSRAEDTTQLLDCKDLVITQCQCGEQGSLQDVYVGSCQGSTDNDSYFCEPCPGNCDYFMYCKTCSKEDCLTCPLGRSGRFCENPELLKSNNVNHTGILFDESNYYVQGVENYSEYILPLNYTDDIPIQRTAKEKAPKHWKQKSKAQKLKFSKKLSLKTSSLTKDLQVDSEEEESMLPKHKHIIEETGSSLDSETSFKDGMTNVEEKNVSMIDSRDMLQLPLKERNETDSVSSEVNFHVDIQISDDDHLALLKKNSSDQELMVQEFSNETHEFKNTSERTNDLTDKVPLPRNFASEYSLTFEIENIKSEPDQTEENPSGDLQDRININSEENNEFSKADLGISTIGLLDEEAKSIIKEGADYFEGENSSPRILIEDENLKDINDSGDWLPVLFLREFTDMRLNETEKPETADSQFSEAEIYELPMNNFTDLFNISLLNASFSSGKGQSEPFQLKAVEKLQNQSNLEDAYFSRPVHTYRTAIHLLYDDLDETAHELEQTGTNYSQILQEPYSSANFSKYLGFESPLNISVFKISILTETDNTSSEEAGPTNVQEKLSDGDMTVNVDGKSINLRQYPMQNTKGANKKLGDVQYNKNILPVEILEIYDMNLFKARETPADAKAKTWKPNDKQISQPSSLMSHIFQTQYDKGSHQSSESANMHHRRFCEIYPYDYSCLLHRQGGPHNGAYKFQPQLQPTLNHYELSDLSRLGYRYPQHQKFYHLPGQYIDEHSNIDGNHETARHSFTAPRQYSFSYNFPDIRPLSRIRPDQLDDSVYYRQPQNVPLIPTAWTKPPLSFGQTGYELASAMLRQLTNLMYAFNLPREANVYPHLHQDEQTASFQRKSALLNDSQAQQSEQHEVLGLLEDQDFTFYPKTFHHRFNRPVGYVKTFEGSPKHSKDQIHNTQQGLIHKTDSTSSKSSVPKHDKFRSYENTFNIPASFLNFGIPSFKIDKNKSNHPEFKSHETGTGLPENPSNESQHLLNDDDECETMRAGLCAMQSILQELTELDENNSTSPKRTSERPGTINIKINEPEAGDIFLNSATISEKIAESLEREEDILSDYNKPVHKEPMQDEIFPSIFRAMLVDEENENQHKDVSESKVESLPRSKRALRENDWCPIHKKMLNGDLDCTIWSYQKICRLECHPGFTCQNDVFKCSRRKNVWEPPMGPCVSTDTFSKLSHRQGINSPGKEESEEDYDNKDSHEKIEENSNNGVDFNENNDGGDSYDTNDDSGENVDENDDSEEYFYENDDGGFAFRQNYDTRENFDENDDRGDDYPDLIENPKIKHGMHIESNRY